MAFPHMSSLKSRFSEFWKSPIWSNHLIWKTLTYRNTIRKCYNWLSKCDDTNATSHLKKRYIDGSIYVRMYVRVCPVIDCSARVKHAGYFYDVLGEHALVEWSRVMIRPHTIEFPGFQTRSLTPALHVQFPDANQNPHILIIN